MQSHNPETSRVLKSLSREERRAFDGDLGDTQQKLMQTMVLYADALQADRFVEVQGPGHLVINDSRPGWGARIEFLEELADAGLKTTFPFTIDPPAPYRDSSLRLNADQIKAMDERYVHEDRYHSLLFKLGLKNVTRRHARRGSRRSATNQASAKSLPGRSRRPSSTPILCLARGRIAMRA